MKLTTLLITTVAMFSLVGCGRYVTDAKDTVYNEYKLSSINQKYKWFKDSASILDAKRATIQQHE